MISRFDHAVIAVPNIDSAIEVYSALGFEVAAGGRHPSLGTRNAIVRFGLDYLELLTVEDADQARARGSFGAELADFLDKATGLVGFVLASAKLEDEAAGLANIGLAHEGPFAMDRERPDGRILAWRLVVPGLSPWRKPWPFLIEWMTPDTDRLSWDPIGRHPNGVTSISGLDLLVEDIDAAAALYENGLGLSPSEGQSHSYTIDGFELRVSEPSSQEMIDELERWGPGPYRLLLRAPDLDQDVIDIEPGRALGARLRLTKT